MSSNPGGPGPGSASSSSGTGAGTGGTGSLGGGKGNNGSNNSAGSARSDAAFGSGSPLGSMDPGNLSAGGSESISGSGRARDSFGEGMGYVRNAQGNPVTNTNGGYVTTPGGFRAPSANMVGYMDSQGTLGQRNMVNGLNTESPGYRTIAGDFGITDRRAKREAMMSQRDKVQPATRTAVERAVMDANDARVAEAKDDGIARKFVETVSPIPMTSLIMDLNDNRLAAEGFNDDLGAIQKDYSIQDGYFGKPDTVDATESVVGDSTKGLLGNPNRMANVALGIDGKRFDNTDAGGGGGRSIIEQSAIPSSPQKIATPGYSSFADNYGSYARNVFSTV